MNQEIMRARVDEDHRFLDRMNVLVDVETPKEQRRLIFARYLYETGRLNEWDVEA